MIPASLPYPCSSQVARLDDLARVLIRLLNDVPVEQLPYRERKRLHRVTKRILAGVSRPELLIDLSGRSR